MRKLSLIRRMAVLGVGACMLLGAGVSAAQAATAGILPPHNPSANCDRANAPQGNWGISNINACRALEGVGPLTLPNNWSGLTPVEQGFVLINLERVNRGMRPIVGLSASLNQLAAAGAAQNNDPSFPSGGFVGGGGIWAGVPSVVAADYLWMYDDGANGLNTNLACPSAGAPGCWGHRQIILWNRTNEPLVAGGGYTDGSYAYLVLSGYSTANLTFTWAQELRHFSTKPGVKPAGKAAARASRRHRKPARRKHHRHRHPTTVAAADGMTISFG